MALILRLPAQTTSVFILAQATCYPTRKECWYLTSPFLLISNCHRLTSQQHSSSLYHTHPCQKKMLQGSFYHHVSILKYMPLGIQCGFHARECEVPSKLPNYICKMHIVMATFSPSHGYPPYSVFDEQLFGTVFDVPPSPV